MNAFLGAGINEGMMMREGKKPGQWEERHFNLIENHLTYSKRTNVSNRKGEKKKRKRERNRNRKEQKNINPLPSFLPFFLSFIIIFF